MNLKYGYSENIKLIMWQLIFFFMIYQFGKDYSSNFFQSIYLDTFIGMVLANLVSLYWFVIQYGIKIPIKYKYYPVRLGWLGNRLFGVYTDPNFGAVISLIVIIIAIYYLVTYKHLNLLFKIFLQLIFLFNSRLLLYRAHAPH